MIFKPSCTLLLAGLLALPAGSALAQYKVVRPDGSVTYTDRPPATEANARITPLSRRSGTASSLEAQLPPELRAAMQRYPVTLYSTPECAPCDNGRKLLQQRGVPYAERRITSDEDVAALERLAGSRTVPALSIGAQQLRGFSEAEWGTYLDAAGYPKESKLPPSWPATQVLPMVDRAPATAARTAPPVDPRPNDPPAQPSQPSGNIRF